MRETLEGARIGPLVVHVPYFVNLASPNPRVWEYSLETVALDLERARRLGAAYVVTHPGVHGPEETAEAGLERVALALERLSDDGEGPVLLLEQTAGGGRQLGGNVFELGTLVRDQSHNRRLGVCIDTCHAFAAGYDLRVASGLQALLEDLEVWVGLERVAVVHLNDSADAPGSRRDVHVRVGEGLLAEAAFRRLLAEPRLAGLPAVLETPRDDDSELALELDRLREWRGRPAKGR